MEQTVYPGGAFLQAAAGNAETTYIDLILYDSSPVISNLTQDVPPNPPPFPGNFTDTENACVNYIASPLARVVRIITFSVSNNTMLVQIRRLRNNPVGKVQPEVIVQDLDNPNLVEEITNERFDNQSSAGGYIYWRTIGFFIAATIRRGKDLVNIPRFSGIWQPFIVTAVPGQYPENKLRVTMVAGTVPFTPRLITGNANEDGKLLELVSLIISGNVNSAFATVSAENRAVDYQTNVPYYRPL